MRRKRSKHGSSSSTTDKNMPAGEEISYLNKELKDSIDCLKKLVTDSIAELQADLNIKLQCDFKPDINEVKSSKTTTESVV